MSKLTVAKTDGLSVGIGVNEKARAKIAKALSGLLASSYTLAIKTQYYHWNVTGPNFTALHEFFGSEYEALSEAIDEVAERIRALGHFTPGTLREFGELSTLGEDKTLPANATAMIKNLLAAHEACSKQARKVLEIAEEGGDEVTIDMMVERMTAHDKTAWMLRANLE